MAVKEVSHFSIRLRVLMIIIAIITGITTASFLLTEWIARNQFKATVEGDMLVSSKIAAALVARELELLERDAESAAMDLLMTRGDLAEAAQRAAADYGYRSLVVLESSGVIHTYGDVLFSDGAFDNEFLHRAFQGESVISSTEKDPNGDLVIRVWVPLDLDRNRVVCAVLPGMILRDKIAGFRIWETGNLFIIDQEGTAIAHQQADLVQNRSNYIVEGAKDPANRGLRQLLSRMLEGGSGLGYYFFQGEQRLCAYTAIEDTDGWVLGVVAPSDESPLSRMQTILLGAHGLFLLFGILAALVTANSVAGLVFQIEKQNRRLGELMTAAENASEAKTNFLASMSHEMRTPLNAIIGLSELELGSEKLQGETYENMEKIYSSGMSLLGIINDILDISKIESGKFELIPVIYDLPSLINDTINLNMVRIGSKPIEFRLHIEETLPARLMGDDLRIKQIFSNLLSNAFKYTTEGTVDWYISGEREEDSFWILSRIEDTGIGIKDTDVSKLFTDYNRVDTQRHRTTEGTGLGLSITRRLVERMDGTITVRSEYGKGSVFFVRLRQGIVGDGIIGLDTATNLVNFRYSVQRRSRNEKLIRAYIPYASVLVVDDVVINLDVARGMLKPYGMVVDCVTSGQQAIDLIRKEKIRYNAIFMDHMMPNMDGIEAVRIIRTEIDSEYARTVPIIALTANALVGNDEMFLTKGFQAFLSKPIDVIRLDGVINRLIRNKALEKELNIPLEREVVEEPGLQIPPAKTVEGLDLVRGLRHFGGSEDAYLQVIRSYFAHTPELIEAIRSPAPETLEEYTISVHSIKGASYTICADVVGKQAEALEQAARSGDTAFIRNRNGLLIQDLEALLRGIGSLLAEIQFPEEKPEKDAPDKELLEAALQAAEDYDIEGLEQAVDGLEAYRYAKGDELVAWLRTQTAQSEFGKIKQRLLEYQGSV